MTLAHWLAGTRTVTVPADRAADLLEVCRRHGIPYDGFRAGADALTVRLTLPALRRLRTAARDVGLPMTVGPLGGLPTVCGHIRRRAGIAVGLFLGLVLVWLSGRYVWDIRIEGTETLSMRDVKDTLSACGFSVGTPLAGFRADVVENRALLYDRRLSWISINRRGTVAYVQVREAVYPPEDTGRDAPANVIALRGGVIERVNLLHGNLLVHAGQTVVPGQLLVSGIFDSERVGFRLTHAEAEVYARTVREMRVEVPLCCETRQPLPEMPGNDRISKQTALIFFKKRILFSKKTGNPDGFCDIIESEKVCSLIPGVGFPISIRTTWYVPRGTDAEPVMLTRTPAEAEALAYLELSRRIEDIPGVELLSETVRPILTEDAFILEVTLTCIENIAAVRPFEAETLP